MQLKGRLWLYLFIFLQLSNCFCRLFHLHLFRSPNPRPSHTPLDLAIPPLPLLGLVGRIFLPPVRIVRPHVNIQIIFESKPLPAEGAEMWGVVRIDVDLLVANQFAHCHHFPATNIARKSGRALFSGAVNIVDMMPKRSFSLEFLPTLVADGADK